MKVKIKDFQAIKNAELEFVPGINVIVGNSNNGKSSIIRAIEGAINNKAGQGFINYDADQCEVTIEDQGQSITWVKSKKQNKSYYDLNGNILNKAGKQQLNEVGELLNMREIEVNSDKFRLNFWKQMEYPFLVDKTSYQLFDFISKSNEQDIILGLQNTKIADLKIANKNIDMYNAQIDLKTSDEKTLKKEIEELSKYAAFNIEKLEVLVSIRDDANNYLNTYNKASGMLDETWDKIKKSKKLITELDKKLKSIEGSVESITKARSLLDKYSKIIFNKDIADTSQKSLAKEVKKLSDKKVKVSGLISEYEKLTAELKNCKEVIDKYKRLDLSILSSKIVLDTIKKEVKKIKDELSTFKVCPLCSKPLDQGGNHE